MADSLARVKRAAARRSRAEEEWRAAVRAAVEEHSHRAVAAAAGISHTRVQQILRE